MSEWSIDDTLKNLYEDKMLLSAYSMKNNVELTGFCPDKDDIPPKLLRYFFNDGKVQGNSYADLINDVYKDEMENLW